MLERLKGTTREDLQKEYITCNNDYIVRSSGAADQGCLLPPGGTLKGGEEEQVSNIRSLLLIREWFVL